jgi:hypothetical protein
MRADRAATGILQRQAARPAGSGPVPTIVHDTLDSPGGALDGPIRQSMESRFGHDFSQVRVHTDSRASISAKALNALAYTSGQHIVFGAARTLRAPALADG